MTTGDTSRGSVGSTGVKEVHPSVSDEVLQYAKELASSSDRRRDTPVRKSFVRLDDPLKDSPLALLVGRGGRGGGVALKLYLALIWRCSAPPFETDISARKWASLLGLHDSSAAGLRRIADALCVLEDCGLVALTRHRGEPSTITLLDESGSGDDYRLPSDSYTHASAQERPRHRYFKVPQALWTHGHIQSMSGPALAMLLILLAEEGGDGRELWWSTEVFPQRYGLSPSTRAKGTRELIGRRLLLVTKRLVTRSPPSNRVFARERVRNVYRLINEATLREKEAPDKGSRGGKGRTSRGRIKKQGKA